MTVRIGLAGVHGHGRGHVDTALELQRTGVATVVAVADPRGPGDVPAGVAHHTDAAEMIARGDLDVVVLSTPIPTHAALAEAGLAAGAHVLLEKPPVVSVAEHERLLAAAARNDRSVQVGFQSLASEGVAATVEAAASGLVGDVVHIAAVGLWRRSEEYWRRAPWAGRRRDGDRVIADGTATNPLAHAIATALAVAGAHAPSDVADVETDLRRINDIEADDTSSLRIRLTGGGVVTAALATTGTRRHEPYVLVRGTAGHLVYFYTLDLLQVFGGGSAVPRTFAYPRHGLLADLCAHARTGSPLRVPLAATGAFTRVLETIVDGPEPVPISGYRTVADGGETFRELDGVAELIDVAAWEGRLFRELGV